MKPKKFNNFKLKDNGELEFFDKDIYIEEYYNRKEICLKLKDSSLRIGTVWDFDIDKESSALKYLDEDLSVVLSEKQLLSKAMNIIESHTEYYNQIEDNLNYE